MMVCAIGPVIGTAKLPPFLATLLPSMSCPCASKPLWSPGGPFLVKAPSSWGKAKSHLTFILLAKNQLSFGVYRAAICPHTLPC